MPTTQELREQRANIWNQMTAIMDDPKGENGALSAEQSTTYDRLETDLDAKGDEVARAERHDRRTAEMGTVDRGELGKPPKPEDGPEATGASARFNTPQYLAAFESYVRGGLMEMDPGARNVLRTGFVQDDSIKNAIGVGSGSAGGYTVPLEFRNKIIERLQKIGSVRSVADHIQTDSGVSLPWPTIDETGVEGAILGENSQVVQQDPTFGTNSLNAWMYTSKLVLVSLQLLNDAGFNVNDKLPMWLGNRLARIQNRHYSVGTGSGQPLGLVTNATVGKVGATGQTTSITFDDLVDLTESVDAAYLEGGNCKWMYSQGLRKIVRKLKDSQGRPLWEPSVQAGSPDVLLSYPTVLNNHMPTPAPSAKSLAFGDYQAGYVVRDVNDVQVLRLTERYADYLQVGFLAFQRSDGTVQDPNAYTVYQHSAT